MASCSSTVKASNTSGTTYANVPSSNGAFSGTGCVLGSGNTGNGVRALQRTLNNCYSSGLSVDGSFGSATRSALVSAQRRAGASPDGVYGPSTRDRLRHAYYRYSNNAFSACSNVYV